MNRFRGFSASIIEADLNREKEAKESKKRKGFTPESQRMYTIGLLCGYAGYQNLSTLDKEYTENDHFNDGYRCGKTRKLTNMPLPKLRK